MTDKLRKYVLPNIPYVFIGWAFLKLGTAYRLAAGGDFAHKFIGLGQTVGAAFADFAPGLAPFDWLVGIVGAAVFRLLIYFKSKNAKKYRRDAEYGSARWGNEKDIKPFADPKFENNMLLTATERLTMNTRPKNPANARNLNFCGIGSSGSGKTRFWLTPQLLQAHSSYVVVDPKGGVLGQVGTFLQKRGYKIKVFNSIDFSKSMHYNPLAYIKTEADILKFVNALISNTKGEGKEGDPFWTKAETLLYEELLRQPEPEARRVATALELYCTGSLNLFNHPTNVDLNSRVVCIVLKGLGENLRKIAMHTTNEFVTAAVNANHAEGVATWCYFDEFHILLRDSLTASYFVAVWKMLRKKGCVPSALTQNVKDLLASREIENILDNTDFMVLLSQAQSDRAILAKQLGISEHQLSYITHSNSGEGLLFYGNVTIPFVDRFPRGEIYDLLTTRPEDLAHERTDE